MDQGDQSQGLAERVRQLESALEQRTLLLIETQTQLNSLAASKAYKVLKASNRLVDRLFPLSSRRRKILKGCFRVMRAIPRRLFGSRPAPAGTIFSDRFEEVFVPEAEYQAWYRIHEPNPTELVRQCSAAFRNAPVISVVVPVYNPPAEYLEAMIASVRVQTYPHWELCLADASTHPHVRPILEKHREQDPRVKVAYLAKNDGIVGNSNAAITLAQGEFLALLDHDDTLAPFALFEVAQAILRSPDADFLYSDEDKLDSQGRRVLPYFKPGWSPDTLRTHNYICHLAVLRRSLVIKIGGFRPGYDGSQDHDLLLRAGEHARQVIHIPQILYHWRMHPNSTAANPDSKTYAYEAGRRAVADHLARTGHQAEVLHGETVGYYQPIYRVHPQPLVSIIVPNRDQPQLLQGCVDAIKQSGHAHFELLIVENGSEDPATDQLYTELARDPRIRILPYSGAFNYSAVNNFAVSQASGELLLFLNNDVRLVDPRWLEVLVRFAVQPGVGAVGAKLLYEDGTIQHAGIALGLGGIAGHMHLHYPGLAKGHMCRLLYSQNVSAVTGACLMTTKSAFEQVGGFDEGFALAYNDVDLCLKLRQAGYRIIWAPDARLTHLESKSRGSDLSPERAERLARESALFQAKWQALLDAGDPYYSPHFRRDRPDFVLNLSQKEQQS